MYRLQDLRKPRFRHTFRQRLRHELALCLRRCDDGIKLYVEHLALEQRQSPEKARRNSVGTGLSSDAGARTATEASAGGEALTSAYRQGLTKLVWELYPFLMAQTGETASDRETRTIAQRLKERVRANTWE